ncbi:MAG: site-specific DNA-methyltransferase [Deltaproteobacteria bacterium]|nr:site-specific DNA-methyltransferase [Deltaproteobacteria bacterium]
MRDKVIRPGHVVNDSFRFYSGNVLDAYATWPSPDAVVSYGAYGIRGFDGDTVGVGGLAEWYGPHLKIWDKAAKPSTTLWFWNSEIGWATVHPLIESLGWKYVQTIVWNKGIGHIAGNVNGKTISRFPVVSEICVLYQRKAVFRTPDGPLEAQEWLRYEWKLTGLPLSRSNEARGVKNAATWKYLTHDWLWYWPPGEMEVKMAKYATKYGEKSGRPYFPVDGSREITADDRDSLLYEWHHVHGLTTVWSKNLLQGEERVRRGGKSAPRCLSRSQASALRFNQKPLEFMRRIVSASTADGGVIWEPFGGLASASVAAVQLNRYPCVAEINEKFQRAAFDRILDESKKRHQ